MILIYWKVYPSVSSVNFFNRWINWLFQHFLKCHTVVGGPRHVPCVRMKDIQRQVFVLAVMLECVDLTSMSLGMMHRKLFSKFIILIWMTLNWFFHILEIIFIYFVLKCSERRTFIRSKPRWSWSSRSLLCSLQTAYRQGIN